MKYSAFWKEFGKSVKLGVIEDSKNRKKLLNLLRFPSTASDEPVSLQSYVDRMKDGQENIYFISAGSLEEGKNVSCAKSLNQALLFRECEFYVQ